MKKNVIKLLTYKEVRNIMDNLKETIKTQAVIITEKKTGKQFKYGEHPYYDMEIENFLTCPKGMENDFFGFCKNDYDLLIQ
jgi:hypothetical protein